MAPRMLDPLSATAAADDRRLQVGFRQPEFSLRFDRGAQHRKALARLGQQGEDIDLHGAEAKLSFVRDDLADRQDLALVVPAIS